MSRTNESKEMLWLVVNNNRQSIRIGIIYAPQESRTTLEKIKLVYQRIQTEIDKANINQQNIIIIGDFNAKVGQKVRGNNKEISKAGKLLIKMVKDNKLNIVNNNPIAEGLWTRIDEKTKSVLDYVIIKQQDEHCIKKMNIDEDKV